jgi:hypothetical protein
MRWRRRACEPVSTTWTSRTIRASARASRDSTRLLASTHSFALSGASSVPAMAARALLRGNLAEPGARPCLEAPSLDQLEQAMGDFRIRFERREDVLRAPFASVPGLDLRSLPEPVRATHTVLHTRVLQGRARVERGRGPLARVLSAVFGFPPDSEDIEVEVTKTREHDQENWRRRFVTREFASRLSIVAPIGVGAVGSLSRLARVAGSNLR